ncbi:MAG: UDP-N-acetylmuramoyl-L-alanine--D-glutamate ligase, partial [Dictyoglomus sp.]
PDHLDRYQSMDEYIRAKERIFMNQNEKDYAIINHDQEEIIKLASKYSMRKLFFGFNKLGDKYGIYYDESSKGIVYKTFEREGILKVPKGIWNSVLLKNFMAASLVGLLLNINDKTIEKTGEEFKGIPFALEKIGEIKGRIFINDSKATNPISTISAIKSINSPIILILGGRNKNFNFEELFEYIKKSNVKSVILIGETKKIMSSLAESYKISYEKADSLEEAVRMGFKRSEPGDVILLSPACASFDMFENYKERGKVFNKIVEKLKNEEI